MNIGQGEVAVLSGWEITVGLASHRQCVAQPKKGQLAPSKHHDSLYL